MNKLTLYFCPLTCARVTMVALEQTGAAFDTRLINIMAGEHKASAYLAINPAGKVPALTVEGQLLTENAAILLYLDGLYPEAGLLPASADAFAVARARSDLIWCATTLHPIARQIRAPVHYTVGAIEDVVAKGKEAMAPVMAAMDARLATQPWWFAGAWSIVDTYLAWVGSACTSAGFDLSPYPQVAAHTQRVTEHPAFKRMLAREAALMTASGVQFPPGMKR